MNRRFLPRAAPLKLICLVLVALVLLSGFSYRIITTRADLQQVSYAPSPHTIALGHPTFEDVKEYERTLPQHRLSVLAAKPRPRYLFFPSEAWGTGWNNVFQEQLLNTHLAYLANRGYVFVDYIARDHPPFPDELPDGTRHMLHIPMNALTSGPTGGGSWGEGANPGAPLPVSKDWWISSCPASETVEVQLADTMKELNITDSTTGEERLVRWAEKLRSIEAECVTIIGGSPFDYMFIGGDKVLSIWAADGNYSYGNSPTLKQYAWSPLVTRAIARNFALISSDSVPPALSPTLSRITTTPGAGSAHSPYPLNAFSPLRAAAPPIRGLLGLHLRRGDYEEHCNNLAWWGAGFNAWNAFGEPPARETGRFPPLPDYLSQHTNESRFDAALRHCWPSPEIIVERARAVRAEAHGQQLSTVYMATNGKPEWVTDVAAKLRADGWDMVSSSVQMQLSRDEFAVSQAVDMGVLVAAETFIGVGFSSLTSNVVQLRLAGGRDPNTSRFW
ncbi:hypothetical protein C8F04DRAFT_1104333 [Mycena alexandri]|uniref:Uncharacterized protein n=1 Tax=Mycena alexandri TaxID=1745969 RepID=A0AAD6SVP9_9AGAR|nr:hypothetical protein C8F04DRAFT_1104333 [Mycena alexandri]